MSVKHDATSDMLLGGLIYFPQIRKQYRALMRQSNLRLFDTENTVYSMIENALRLYIMTDTDVPPETLIKLLLGQYENIAPGNKEDRAMYAAIMQDLCRENLFSLQICQRIHQEYAKANLVSALSGVSAARSIPQIMEVLQTVQTKLNAVSASEVRHMKLYNPIRDQMQLMRFRPRIPTGISFIDRITGGGIVFGDHMGILGPSSGGKTVLAIQLVCNLAIQGHKVLYLQFEQPVEGNIIARIQSYLTGLPIDTFENLEYSMLSAEVKSKLETVLSISDNIRVASFLDESMDGVRIASAADIIRKIDESIEEDGFTPRFVVFDWLGACVSSILRTSNDKAIYQHTAQDIQDTLNDYGKTHDMTMCYMHQTKEEVQAMPSSYKPKKGDGYWFSAFHQKLELCLQLGTATKQADGTKVCWLVNGKSRCTGTMDDALVIRLNGRFARMEETKDNEYVIAKGGSFKRTADLYEDAKPKKGDIFYESSVADDFINGYT